jgi:hypothetical protein
MMKSIKIRVYTILIFILALKASQEHGYHHIYEEKGAL